MKRTLIATAVAATLSIAAALPAMAASDDMSAPQATTEQSATGASINAGELIGKDITNMNGEAIGEVTSVVRDTTTDAPYAVISVGGILGFGDKKVTIPLRDMQMRENALTAPLASTEDELKTHPAFIESQFTGIDDAELVQVGAQTGMPATGDEVATQPMSPPPMSESTETVGFGTLDVNRDGYVSKEEANSNQGIAENWDRVDTNGDNRLDQSEFSAFEPTGMTPQNDKLRPAPMPEGTGEGIAPAYPSPPDTMK